MKRFEFEISPSVLNKFFPKYRVKNRVQILNILLEAVRYTISYNTLTIGSSKGKLVLVVDKMSRLFFSSETKVYSISFPFLTLETGNGVKFSLGNVDVDSYLVSNLIRIITDGSFMDGYSIDFLESPSDDEVESESFWLVLRELLMYEDGYIRYDCDNIGFKDAKEKGHEHRHPLHHFDLFYSNKATFKIGLERKIDINALIDILDITTDCNYLKKLR